jgi:hypothetical protein
MQLLDEEEGAEGEGIYPGAVERADSGTRIGDEGFTEEIEAGVDENGSRGGFAEFVEEPPETRVGFLFDGMDAKGIAVEGKTFETGEGIFERTERSHEAAIGTAIEILGGAFGRDRKREGMELFAVLDVLIHIFHDIFGER